MFHSQLQQHVMEIIKQFHRNSNRGSIFISLHKPYNYSSIAAQSACGLASCYVAAVPLATAVSSSSLRWTSEVTKELFSSLSDVPLQRLRACQKM